MADGARDVVRPRSCVDHLVLGRSRTSASFELWQLEARVDGTYIPRRVEEGACGSEEGFGRNVVSEGARLESRMVPLFALDINVIIGMIGRPIGHAGRQGRGADCIRSCAGVLRERMS